MGTLSDNARASRTAPRSDKSTTALVLPSSGAIQPRRAEPLNGGSRACYLGSGERKRTSVFFITLRLAETFFPDIRSVFIQCLPETVVYCVAIEQGDSSSCKYHLHAYIEFVGKYCLNEVRDMCFQFFGENNFDCQTVKNRKRLLAYVSKEDMNIFYNCKVSDLSFNYQAYYYLSKMPVFDYNHFFVKSNRFCYKYLMQLHSQIHVAFQPSWCYLGPLVIPDLQWCKDVYDWYVNFVSTSYYTKKKHLYLYGQSNVGKSYFIKLLTQYLGNRVYYPSYTHYFESLTREHKLILWDEFDYLRVKYNDNLFKLVFGGEKFPITRRYCDDRIFNVDIPCILISNYVCSFDEALANRFVVIYAGDFLQVTPAVIKEVCTFVGDITEEGGNVPSSQEISESEKENLP